MSGFHFKKTKYPRTAISSLLAIAFLMFFILLFMNGCGAKKKAQEEAAELDPGQQRVADWHTLMREKIHASEMEKIESVNSFFNKLVFVDDLYHWGKKDY